MLTQSDVLVHPASLSHLNELAYVLTMAFHPPVGAQGLVWPILKFGIQEDLRRRLGQTATLYCCLGAWSKAGLVGTLEIGLRQTSAHDASQTPYIANLAVLNEWRRQGVGRQLITMAEAVAASWNYHEVYLHVLAGNTAARRLYQSLNYRVQRVQPVPWWAVGAEQQLLLTKNLKSD